jgi:hypothetical protein
MKMRRISSRIKDMLNIISKYRRIIKTNKTQRKILQSHQTQKTGRLFSQKILYNKKKCSHNKNSRNTKGATAVLTNICYKKEELQSQQTQHNRKYFSHKKHNTTERTAVITNVHNPTGMKTQITKWEDLGLNRDTTGITSHHYWMH